MQTKSSIRWNRGLDTYECAGCDVLFEIPAAVKRDPERLLMWKESAEEAHKACVEIARAAEAAKRLRQAWGLELAEATRQ